MRARDEGEANMLAHVRRLDKVDHVGSPGLSINSPY